MSPDPSSRAEDNLNYRLYCAARSTAQALRNRVPASLVPPRRHLAPCFAIGVTTYSERYDRFFRHLYAAIRRVLPEVTLTVAVNGHGTAEAQASYLDRFEREICADAPPHHRFVLHDRAHGLTTLWNAMVAASPEDRPLLILNDDLTLHPWFRRWAEAFPWAEADLALLNTSWSHFVVSPAVVRKVGAFDPGFPGIGFEDMDYTARAGLAGVSISNHLCGYLHHKDDKPATTSFDAMSERVWGKYTSANQEHFQAQWEPCSEGEGIWIKQLKGWVRPRRPVVPFAPPTLAKEAWKGNRLFPDRI